jgi:hypothetical protein
MGFGRTCVSRQGLLRNSAVGFGFGKCGFPVSLRKVDEWGMLRVLEIKMGGTGKSNKPVPPLDCPPPEAK